MAAKKFDLPDAIIVGGFAAFADFFGIFVPGVGTLFLLVAYGGFKLIGVSTPLPWGSMIAKALPGLSALYFFGCTLYIWRVYQRNQPGNMLSAITDAVPNPAVAVASVVPGKILPGPGSSESQVNQSVGVSQHKKAA